MKQVWIVNHYAQAPGEPGSTRHFHLADHLLPCGWQATIIAASVEHFRGKQRLQSDQAQRLDRFDGVPYLWVKTPEYKGNGGKRILNMLVYTCRVLLKSTTRELPLPDVVIGSSAHPFAAVAGAWLARRHKVPFIFEVRDLWPQTLVDMGRLREGAALTWALRKLERWLYRRAACTVVLLPRAWEYIVPLGVPKERVVWIPNGVDLSLFPPSEPPVRTAAEPFTLMYFGAHGQANALDHVLQAMKYVQQRQIESHDTPRILLRLIGDGPLKLSLMAQAQQLGLTNVNFEPPVPKSQIPALATEADAFVIPVADLPNLYRYGISPNKLFDYLAAQRPIIIATAIIDNSVAESCAGITVPPNRPEKIADAILQMASLSYSERKKMGEAGRKYVEANHDFINISRKLADVLVDAIDANDILK